MYTTDQSGIPLVTGKRHQYQCTLANLAFQRHRHRIGIHSFYRQGHDDISISHKNILIPFIKKEFNPNIIKGINNLSEIVTEEQNYLEKIVNNIYSQIKIEETKEKVILDLKEFNKQDTIIKKRILLISISRIFGTSKNIERIHIEDIIKLCERNIGNKYLTPNKNVKVFVNKGKIIISHTY